MTTHNRRIAQIIKATTSSDGAGVKLKRILSPSDYSLFDPFLLLDEFGSDNPNDYSGGFPAHPHRGFETVTYMLAGAMKHQDHLGNQGHLKAGDVQWMTAARGIIHSEMPEQDNGLLHGFQLWLNLPAAQKMQPPSYHDFTAADIPSIALADKGYINVVAGSININNRLITGVVTSPTTVPLFLDVVFTKANTCIIPIPSNYTAFVYVYQGELIVTDDQPALLPGQLARLTVGNQICLSALQSLRCLVLAALPLGEPMVQSGPFVMTTRAELEQAYQDYRDGTLTQ